MAALSAETQARNRELIAERLDWPPGALGIVRWVEGNFPGYRVWWGHGRVDRPADGYYAICHDNSEEHHATVYGTQADDLIAGIERDITLRDARYAAEKQVWDWR
jgi:hypothetical protein